MIGDQIEVTVLSVSGEKVRLGVKAPREVPVYRDEVFADLQSEIASEPSGAEVASPNP
jgi:carbon storage regulator